MCGWMNAKKDTEQNNNRNETVHDREKISHNKIIECKTVILHKRQPLHRLLFHIIFFSFLFLCFDDDGNGEIVTAK